MHMPSNPEPTETDESSSNFPRFERRPVLKALGAGAALTLGSGAATAGDDAVGEPDIDPEYGLAVTNADDIPEELPDHEVELHIVLNEPESDHASFYAHFEPTGLQVESGDIVQFTYESPEHTISAYRPEIGYQPRVPEGTSLISSPIVGIDGAWLYDFTETGVYDLFCGPHHVFGMNMRIVVGDPDEEDYPMSVAESWANWEEGDLFAPWDTGGLERELNEFSDQNEGAEWSWLTPQEVLDAPALDPSSIREDGTVSFEDVLGDIDRFGDELPDRDE